MTIAEEFDDVRRTLAENGKRPMTASEEVAFHIGGSCVLDLLANGADVGELLDEMASRLEEAKRRVEALNPKTRQ